MTVAKVSNGQQYHSAAVTVLKSQVRSSCQPFGKALVCWKLHSVLVMLSDKCRSTDIKLASARQSRVK